MTTPVPHEGPAGRPVPDTDDLRILAELINNDYIGLPQAAWNARMSQREAADRLVTMAERGMPLRLVAEGDRQALWRIAQAGPATGGLAVPPSGPAPAAGPSGAVPVVPPQSGALPVPRSEPAHPVAPPAPTGQSQPVVSVPQSSPAQLSGPVGPQSLAHQSFPPPSPAPQASLPPAPPPSVPSGPWGPGAPPVAPPAPAQYGGAPAYPGPVQDPRAAPDPRHQGPMTPGPGFGPPPSAMPVPGPPAPVVAAWGPPPGGDPATSAPLPPTPAVPPHEQAIAGAVPLGEPPFGTPQPGLDDARPSAAADVPPAAQPAPPAHTGGLAPEAAPIAPETGAENMSEPTSTAQREARHRRDSADPASVWGIPGTAWARTDEDGPADPAPQSAPTADPSRFVLPDALVSAHLGAPPAPADPSAPPVVSAPPALGASSAPADNPPPAAAPPSEPVPPAFAPRAVAGLFGERLTVTVSAWLDPADTVLTGAGYRLDAGERAVLARTDLHNDGPIDYESLPDLYLELITAQGQHLAKASISAAGHPAHRVGVPAGSTSSGWTVFLVPADTQVAAIQWSVRPDLADRTVRWETPR